MAGRGGRRRPPAGAAGGAGGERRAPGLRRAADRAGVGRGRAGQRDEEPAGAGVAHARRLRRRRDRPRRRRLSARRRPERARQRSGWRRSCAMPRRRWSATRRRAAELAREALALADGLPRRRTTTAARWGRSGGRPRRTRPRRATVLARAWSRTGAHADALPALEAAHAEHPEDESLLADLLRSEAVVRGPGAALERYERYRRDLRERLGASPGERLQRAHRDLLALDRPERTGRALRRHAAARPRRRHRGPASADRELARRVDRRAGRAGQDAPGARAGARRDAAGRARGRARRRHRRRRPGGRGRLRARRARLDQRPPDADAGAAGRRPRARRPAPRAVAEPARARQLRAPRRRGRRARRVPRLDDRATCACSRRAGRRWRSRPSASTCSASSTATTRCELFRERAIAARPGVRLADDVVRRIVRPARRPAAGDRAGRREGAGDGGRGDRPPPGGPLRAAARRRSQRARPPPDAARGDRLVVEPARPEPSARALRRLALFNDGFTLEAAEAVLGDDALDAVQGLVDQSLLSVRETPAGLRYRMLETVREFGRMQLVDAGEDAEARAARAPLGDRATPAATAPRLIGARPVRGDRRRRASRRSTSPTSCATRSPTATAARWSSCWPRSGCCGRCAASTRGCSRLAGAVAQAIGGWSPPPELEDAARAAMVITLSNTMMTVDEHSEPHPGAAGAARPRQRRPADRRGGPGPARVRRGPRRRVRSAASCSWRRTPTRRSRGRPASGSATFARTPATRRAPWRPPSARSRGPTTRPAHGRRRCCTPSSRELTMHLGRPGPRRGARPSRAAGDGAARRDRRRGAAALAARPVRDRRRATWRRPRPSWSGSTGSTTARCSAAFAVRQIGAAELALARGDRAGGLRAYRESAEAMRALRFPGIEPDRPGAVGAVRGVDGADRARAPCGGRRRGARPCSCSAPAASARCAASIPRIRSSTFRWPGWCCSASAPGACCATRCRPTHAVRLLVLAERFAYNRTIPTMAWERIAPRAEERAPGRIAALQAGLPRPPAA